MKIIFALPFMRVKPEYNVGNPVDLLKTENIIETDVSELNWDIHDVGKLKTICIGLLFTFDPFIILIQAIIIIIGLVVFSLLNRHF